MRKTPPAPSASTVLADPVKDAPVLGLRPNTVFALLCVAIVGYCIPMSMPMGHLVALCSDLGFAPRSEEHTSELQSLMRISYAVFCLKKKNTTHPPTHSTPPQPP